MLTPKRYSLSKSGLESRGVSNLLCPLARWSDLDCRRQAQKFLTHLEKFGARPRKRSYAHVLRQYSKPHKNNILAADRCWRLLGFFQRPTARDACYRFLHLYLIESDPKRVIGAFNRLHLLVDNVESGKGIPYLQATRAALLVAMDVNLSCALAVLEKVCAKHQGPLFYKSLFSYFIRLVGDRSVFQSFPVASNITATDSLKIRSDLEKLLKLLQIPPWTLVSDWDVNDHNLIAQKAIIVKCLEKRRELAQKYGCFPMTFTKRETFDLFGMLQHAISPSNLQSFRQSVWRKGLFPSQALPLITYASSGGDFDVALEIVERIVCERIPSGIEERDSASKLERLLVYEHLFESFCVMATKNGRLDKDEYLAKLRRAENLFRNDRIAFSCFENEKEELHRNLARKVMIRCVNAFLFPLLLSRIHAGRLIREILQSNPPTSLDCATTTYMIKLLKACRPGQLGILQEMEDWLSSFEAYEVVKDRFLLRSILNLYALVAEESFSTFKPNDFILPDRLYKAALEYSTLDQSSPKLHVESQLMVIIYLGRGQLDEAEKLISFACPMKLRTRLYNSLMTYWMNYRGDYEKVESVFAEMQTNGVRPSSFSIETLVTAVLRSNLDSQLLNNVEWYSQEEKQVVKQRIREALGHITALEKLYSKECCNSRRLAAGLRRLCIECNIEEEFESVKLLFDEQAENRIIGRFPEQHSLPGL